MKKLAIIPLSIVLAACGGGSDSTSDPVATPPPPPTQPDPQQITVAENKLSAWIWYIDQPGLVRNNHADMAEYLADLGVKRVFIKISDINYRWQDNKIRFEESGVFCGEWQDACEPDNIQHYIDAGIEPWAWTYNDTHSYAEQADMLYAAAKVGYQGFVLDIEEEFNRVDQPLHDLLQAHHVRLRQARAEGIIDNRFLLAATSWGNPEDQGMNIGIIDQYVDAHMPQTYIEKWGGSYLSDIAATIEAGDCEYQRLGATKPVWHIVSHEDNILTAEQLDTFIAHAGPNASVWRISDATLANAIEGINWQQLDYTVNDCSNSNMELLQHSSLPLVPYYHQLENLYQPTATCSVTSLAMVTDFFAITTASDDERVPDQLYQRFGLLQTVPELTAAFNELATEAGIHAESTGLIDGTFAQLQQHVSSGLPAIVHGWFTPPGHILVVTGYDGDYYTVNDPYGEWNLERNGSYDTEASGFNIRYPKAAFEQAINDNGTDGDLWLHLFQPVSD
ncbi:C39 family peptidase [Alkalimonas collagenimarina]|uniref:C39 family peptidase n=1 Tax=Alkalimonas collagenimarina TaxID=400390 RepID=A0ABT9H018_9GAMM|nr:C39 family peptidase [Alkalimonas collagenimarina]MDP4536654.1 C39 family peptidase [Alkalimonas collagenimarina]